MPQKPKKPAKTAKPKKPNKKLTAEAKSKIFDRLSNTSESLVGSKVHVHEYADGSVDGELTMPVPRGTPTRAAFLDMEDAFKKQSLGKGYWISAGVRFVIKTDDEVYRRYKGMNDVQTNYQRMTPSNIAEIFLIARDQIAGGMERKYRRKAELIFLRLHWNQNDAQPKR